MKKITEKQRIALARHGILADDIDISSASRIISVLSNNDWNSKEQEVKDAVYKNGARYGRKPKASNKRAETKKTKEAEMPSKAFGNTLVFFDLETLGLSPKEHEIIEYAGIKYENGKEVERLHMYIKPYTKFKVNPTNTITWDMVKDSDWIVPSLKKIIEFQKDCTLVAHNASFDCNFLKHYLDQELGETLDNQVLCTLKLSRSKLKKGIHVENHKLGTLIDYFNIDKSDKRLHHALDDVELMIEVYEKLINL